MVQPRFAVIALVAAGLAVALPAVAQVTVNPKALEPLGGAPAQPSSSATSHRVSHAHHGAHHAHAKARASAPVATAKPAAPRAEAPGKPASATAAPKPPASAAEKAAPNTGARSLVHQPPVVPEAPPPVATLAPLEPPPPPHPAPPAQPVPVVAGAPGDVQSIRNGVRVTFGPDSADFNPQTDAALQELAQRAAARPDATVTVTAYAAGPPDDPSTPRRLSLSRALAARQVLLQKGVGSTHIYVRALGANAGEGPADRVDVTLNLPAAGAAAKAE
jgi:outer membrane protein OmpA-like peptidoglycan-associated protein